MLEKQNRVTGYRNSSAVSEYGQGNLTPAVDPDINNLFQGDDDDDDLDLDDVTDRESAQRVGVKRKLLHWQD